MAVAGCGRGAERTDGIVRVFCHRAPCPLGWCDDHTQTISDFRVLRCPPDTWSNRFQPPAAEGMPAASPRRCGRSPVVRQELSGRLYLLRLGALAAAHFADLQGLAKQAGT